MRSPSKKPKSRYKARGAMPFGSPSRKVETVISCVLSKLFIASERSAEAIPCLRRSGATARQQIILCFFEKSKTPTMSAPFLTHRARSSDTKRSTVSLYSLRPSSVSRPGKLWRTCCTSFIQEEIYSCFAYSTFTVRRRNLSNRAFCRGIPCPL